MKKEKKVSVQLRHGVYTAIAATARNRGFAIGKGIEFALIYVSAHPEIYDAFIKEFLAPKEKLIGDADMNALIAKHNPGWESI